MPQDFEFRATVWKTGNSLVLTIPSYLVSSHDIEPGTEFDVRMSPPAFVIDLPRSSQAALIGFIPLSAGNRNLFPPDRERFTLEVEGKPLRVHVAARKISGIISFLRAHPKLTRIRVRVIEPMRTYRLEFEPTWEA